jgi:patatin-like phospholipase/acyl hydrolase
MKIKKVRRFFKDTTFKIVDYSATCKINLDELFRGHNVLQIDGGGIKGVMAAYHMFAIEEKYGKVNEHFKYMYGTSTGAILTAALACGIPAKEMLRLYVEEGADIFQERGLPFGSKYNNKYAIKTLKEKIGNVTFEELFKRTGVELNIQVVNATSYQEETWNHVVKPNEKVWFAVLCSMSAPTYFPPVRNDNYIYLDGGTGVMNCTLRKAVNQMYYTKGMKSGEFFILSFGCGRIKQEYKKTKLGQALWAFNFGREQSIVQQEKEFVYRQANLGIIGFRWNTEMTKKLNEMDNTKNIPKLVEIVDK